MRRRPSRHNRMVRTKHGRVRRLINPHIPPRRRAVRERQGSLARFMYLQERERQARENASELQKFLRNRLRDPTLTIDLTPQQPRFKKSNPTPKNLTPPQGELMTRKEREEYDSIVKTARRKGYTIPRVDLAKGPVIFDEVNIPETSQTEAFVLPDKDLVSGKDTYLILLDDDAARQDKIKAFAHELGHVHMYEKNVKPHTEAKADKIAAKILNTTIEDIQQSEHLKDNLARLQRRRL